MKRWFVVMIAGWMIGAGAVAAQEVQSTEKISSRLQADMVAADTASFTVWIYFTDKDRSQGAYRKAAGVLADRARLRRSDIPTDWYDLPVTAAYCDTIAALGGEIRRTSRWMNAVSARLTADQVNRAADLAFVRLIEKVLVLSRPLGPEIPSLESQILIDSADYGPSYTQVHMLDVDSLHRLTIPSADTTVPLNGAGVLMAFFDTGFLLSHPSFDSINVLDTWDFINDDATVDDNQPVDEQRDHGTAVLSAAAGFAPGNLIGPAYGADFILAKTELTAQEFQIEEDNWVAAAEWSDSLGADIISTSLGYNDWYTYADMDGRTAVTTIAAEIAASRGILVINCAGNEGTNSWHYIIAPADGDSVVAVGAVDATGVIIPFSSWGPTYDGRIKPDVVAMGSGVRSAYYQGGYASRSGTSLSTPLISGSAALMLQANPVLRGKPDLSKKRLTMSANKYDNPDYHYGYGLPDMVLAAGFGLKIMPVGPITISVFRDTTIVFNALGPTTPTVVFQSIDLPPEADFVNLGDGVATMSFSLRTVGGGTYRVTAHAGSYADTLEFVVTGTGSGDEVSVGPNPFADSLRVYFGGEAS
ncbi:MAG: S8 family serine peptidase, partial [candidate division Zixibacteria bacterium]|nr:S8 family serine peptidase [candidate division Zixibacteria bacterium]